MNKKIIIFYKYITLPDQETVRLWQKAFCQNLGLTGRIIIAKEGINGTLFGDYKSLKLYIQAMNQHSLFGSIDFKFSPGKDQAEYFPRLKVSCKPEICHLGVDPEIVTVADTGIHLTPEQVHELLGSEDKDLVVLDTRNNYESCIGKFNNAITPDITTFKELPEYIDSHEDLFKDKKVLMYCTAGVRCERATAYLNKKNIAKEVFQIQGGIQRYIERFPDGYFRGKNYVFDNRIAVKVNDDILGSCQLCNAVCDDYTNCLNILCNNHYIGCSLCIVAYGNTCSVSCRDLVLSGQVAKRKPFVRV